jgi:hypothetical protein
MINLIFIFVLFVCLTFVHSSFTPLRTFYVASDNDATADGDGTLEKPFQFTKIIAKNNQISKPGDLFILK